MIPQRSSARPQIRKNCKRIFCVLLSRLKSVALSRCLTGRRQQLTTVNIEPTKKGWVADVYGQTLERFSSRLKCLEVAAAGDFVNEISLRSESPVPTEDDGSSAVFPKRWEPETNTIEPILFVLRPPAFTDFPLWIPLTFFKTERFDIFLAAQYSFPPGFSGPRGA